MRLFLSIILLFISLTAFSQDRDKYLRKAYSRESIDLLNNFLYDWNIESSQLVKQREDSIAKYDELIESFYNENKVKKLQQDDYIIIDYRAFIVHVFSANKALENEITDILDTLLFDYSIDLNNLFTDSSYFREYKYETSIILLDSISSYYPKQVDKRTLLLTDEYYNMLTEFLQGTGNDIKKKEFLRKRINGFYQDGRSFTMNRKIKKIFLSSSREFAIIDWHDGYCWGQEVYLVYKGEWIRIKELIEICE